MEATSPWAVVPPVCTACLTGTCADVVRIGKDDACPDCVQELGIKRREIWRDTIGLESVKAAEKPGPLRVLSKHEDRLEPSQGAKKPEMSDAPRLVISKDLVGDGLQAIVIERDGDLERVVLDAKHDAASTAVMQRLSKNLAQVSQQLASTHHQDGVPQKITADAGNRVAVLDLSNDLADVDQLSVASEASIPELLDLIDRAATDIRFTTGRISARRNGQSRAQRSSARHTQRSSFLASEDAQVVDYRVPTPGQRMVHRQSVDREYEVIKQRMQDMPVPGAGGVPLVTASKPRAVDPKQPTLPHLNQEEVPSVPDSTLPHLGQEEVTSAPDSTLPHLGQEEVPSAPDSRGDRTRQLGSSAMANAGPSRPILTRQAFALPSIFRSRPPASPSSPQDAEDDGNSQPDFSTPLAHPYKIPNPNVAAARHVASVVSPLRSPQSPVPSHPAAAPLHDFFHNLSTLNPFHRTNNASPPTAPLMPSKSPYPAICGHPSPYHHAPSLRCRQPAVGEASELPSRPTPLIPETGPWPEICKIANPYHHAPEVPLSYRPAARSLEASELPPRPTPLIPETGPWPEICKVANPYHHAPEVPLSYRPAARSLEASELPRRPTPLIPETGPWPEICKIANPYHHALEVPLSYRPVARSLPIVKTGTDSARVIKDAMRMDVKTGKRMGQEAAIQEREERRVRNALGGGKGRLRPG